VGPIRAGRGLLGIALNSLARLHFARTEDIAPTCSPHMWFRILCGTLVRTSYSSYL